MSSLVGPALVAGSVVVALLVLLLLGTGLAHRLRIRRAARDARSRAELTPVVHALLDDDVPDADLAGAPAALDTVVLGLLPQLRGADRAVLQRVLASRGVVARAAADLRSRRAWRRGRAAALLGATAGGDHTAALCALLDDPSADVRSAAARALGKTGDPAAAPVLMAALTGARPLPHGIAGMALLDLGTPALPALREALRHRGSDGSRLAAELLGLHGDLAATEALTGVLGDRFRPAGERAAAAAALGRIGAPQAGGPLAAVLTWSAVPALRCAAAEALGRIGDPAAVPALVDGVTGPYPDVRTACADALVLVGDEGRDALEVLAGRDDAAAPAAAAALEAAPSSRRRPVVAP